MKGRKNMKKIEIEEGETFGRWKVLNEEILKNVGISKKRTFLKCLCECGTIDYVRKDYLLKGSSKSCGCLKKDLARQKGKKQKTEIGYIRSLFGDCRRSSKKRKIDFDLKFEEYKSLCILKCYYCNSEPSLRKIKNPTGIPLPTNGIDRKDSSKGYTKENSVSCCWLCNNIKNSTHIDDFLNHIQKIYKHTNQ